MAISNPLNGMRKAGTVGKPFSGVQVSQVNRKELMFIDTFFFFFLGLSHQQHFCLCDRSRFWQKMRMEMVLMGWVSFALKALHRLRSIGNFLRYFLI
jgi:hypothetical protein